MSNADEKIERFRKMAEADPANELGHFSLGRALHEAKRWAEAIAAFERTIAINPEMSKAYQLLAEAQLSAERKGDAIATLRKGHAVAMRRGDLMPARSMANILRRLGEPVDSPQPAATHTTASAQGSEFRCHRCGGGEAMTEPPMRGATGEQIRESICVGCWREWLRMGTKVINELRLDFREPAAQETYDAHMKEFLGL